MTRWISPLVFLGCLTLVVDDSAAQRTPTFPNRLAVGNALATDSVRAVLDTVATRRVSAALFGSELRFRWPAELEPHIDCRSVPPDTASGIASVIWTTFAPSRIEIAPNDKGQVIEVGVASLSDSSSHPSALGHYMRVWSRPAGKWTVAAFCFAR